MINRALNSVYCCTGIFNLLTSSLFSESCICSSKTKQAGSSVKVMKLSVAKTCIHTVHVRTHARLQREVTGPDPPPLKNTHKF